MTDKNNSDDIKVPKKQKKTKKFDAKFVNNFVAFVD